MCVSTCNQFYEAMMTSATSDWNSYAKKKFIQGMFQNCLKICIAIMVPSFFESYSLYNVIYMFIYCNPWASLVAQWYRICLPMQETVLIPRSGRSPGGGNCNPLQYSCGIIPWTEEFGRLQSRGSQRVGHDWSDCTHTSIVIHYLQEDCRAFVCDIATVMSTSLRAFRPYWILRSVQTSQGQHCCAPDSSELLSLTREQLMR